MRYCTQCGAKNKNTATYCTSCGHKLDDLLSTETRTSDDTFLSKSELTHDSFSESNVASEQGTETASTGAVSAPNSHNLLKLIILIAALIFVIPKAYTFIQRSLIPNGSNNYNTILSHVAKHDHGNIQFIQLTDLINDATENQAQFIYIEQNNDTKRYVFPIKIAKQKTYCYVVKVVVHYYDDDSYKYSYVAVSLNKNKQGKYSAKILKPNSFNKKFHQKDAYGITTKEFNQQYENAD